MNEIELDENYWYWMGRCSQAQEDGNLGAMVVASIAANMCAAAHMQQIVVFGPEDGDLNPHKPLKGASA